MRRVATLPGNLLVGNPSSRLSHGHFRSRMVAWYLACIATWQRLHSAFAPSKSPACAFAAPAAQYEPHEPNPGGGRPPIDSKARARRSGSPEATAPPAAPFIHRCIGQSGCPFDPQSNTLPAGALLLAEADAEAEPDAEPDAEADAEARVATAIGAVAAPARDVADGAEGNTSKSAMI